LKKDIEEKSKFPFYEAKSLFFEFWDIRGIFSNCESPNAPTKDELEIMFHALVKHALALSSLKVQGIHHEN